MRYLIAFLFSLAAMAEPEYVEIWFLSEKRTTYNLDLMPVRALAKVSLYVPENIPCTPFGDGCFHPQYGYFDKETRKTFGSHDELEDNKKPSNVDSKTISNMNTDLINCDRGYHFDMFCGKAKPVKREIQKFNKLEIWVDTSSSFRGIDPAREDGTCYRKSFVDRLRRRCNGQAKISAFDTSKKEVGSTDTLCTTVGTNSTDRIIKWIDESEAKTLILITDIHEYNMKLADYLDQVNHKIRGEIPRKEIISSDLNGEVDRIARYCK